MTKHSDKWLTLEQPTSKDKWVTINEPIKPQPTAVKAPVVNKPVVKQPVTQTKQPKAKTWFDNAKAYVIENSNQTNEQWKQMAQKALNDRAEYEQKHPIISEFQKTLQPGYAANVHKWEQEAKYGHRAPFKEKIATSLKMQRSDIAPMTNIALLPFGGEGAVWTAGKVLPVASKAKPVAEFVAKHPFIAKTIAGTPATAVEGAGFGLIDKALSDASGIETDYDYVDAAKMGALIGPAAHGAINTAFAAGKGLSKTKPIQAISKAHDDLLNSDTVLGNTLANIEGTISNALNLGSKNETVNKYKSLDEAIARGNVPMNKQLTPEELELIKMEQNLTDEQAWQLKHMLDNGVNSPENVADDLSHVKPETDNLTPKTEEPAVKTQPDMSGEVSEKPLLDNFQTEEQFEQLPKQPKQKVVEDNNYVIPKQEQTISENNYFKRTKSPSTQEALANYEKNTGKKVSTIEPEEAPVKPQSIQPNKVESMPKVKPVKNKSAFPAIKENKKRAGMIVAKELKSSDLYVKRREHKLAEILNNPEMDKKVEKTIRRLMDLRPSSEVEQALNTIYRNAPQRHRDLIARNNMRGYKLNDVPVNNKPLVEPIMQNNAQTGKLTSENIETPVKTQTITKLPAGKAEGSDWDNTLRVKPKAKRIGSDDLIENEDVINEFNEGLSTKLDKDGKPLKAQDKYRTDDQVEVENISKGVETQAANDLLPDDVDSLQKEIAEYQANNTKLPRIKENKAIAEKIVNSELGVVGINNTVKSTKLTNILKTPKMDEKVQRCLQRLFALKQSREVEKVINKIYSNAPDTHRKFIEELNNGKYTLDARELYKTPVRKEDATIKGDFALASNIHLNNETPRKWDFEALNAIKNASKNKARNSASTTKEPMPIELSSDKYDEWGNIKKFQFNSNSSLGDVAFSINKRTTRSGSKNKVLVQKATVNKAVSGKGRLADALKSVGDVKVKFFPNGHPNYINGQYNSKTDTIYLFNNGQNIFETLAHEARHAMQARIAKALKKVSPRYEKIMESCYKRGKDFSDFKNTHRVTIEKHYDILDAFNRGEISANELTARLSNRECSILMEYNRLYTRYKNCYSEVDANAFARGDYDKKLFGKDIREIQEIQNATRSKNGVRNEYQRYFQIDRSPQSPSGLSGGSSVGSTNNRPNRIPNEEAQYKLSGSRADVYERTSGSRKGVQELRKDGALVEETKSSSSPEITPEVQQIYDYYKKLHVKRQASRIERGSITEEQAKNRLKQQGDGSGNGIYYKTEAKPTSESEFIDFTKDYNARRDAKEGEYGIKKEDGTDKPSLKRTIEDAIQEKHTKFALDLVDEHFAKPIENGKIQAGYVGINRALLGTAINRRYGTSWYETMLKGGDAIDKAFNEAQAKGWKMYAERNNKLDYQIPKQVFDKLFDGSGETVAEYWSKYGKTHTHKAIAKTAGALLDAYNNSFKRGVLTSLSFWVNNRMGNQIMLAAKSNPIEHARSVFEAFAMKDSDVPIELVESSLLEAMNNFKARKTYTGWNAFDNMLNLFGGHEIKTETLKKMVQPSKPVGVKNYVKMNGEIVLEGTELKGTWKSGAAEVGNKCIALPNKVFDKVCDKLMKFNEVFERFERKQAFAIQVNKAKKQIMKTTGQKMITTEEAIKHLEAHPEMMEVVIKNVEDVLGDYNKFNNTEKKIFKRIVPFYSWYRTITRHTLSIARENPTRLALIALEMQQINERGEDRKEWQKGAFDTRLFDGRTGRKILSNKTAQIPYNTFKELFEENAKGSISPAITKPIEAARGKKFFNDSEITSRRYKRVSKYNVNSKKYEADGYLDKKTGKKVKDLPLSARAGYLGKEALQTAYPILRSPLVKAESLIQGVDKAVKDGNFLEPDAIYDADFGGYYHNEHFYGKEKRYASGQMDQGFKTANRLGLSLQTQRPLNKQERAELNKKRKEKNKRFIDRFKNS